MSETDSFIQEVTEEVRQDRMFALWKKWVPAIIGAIVLVVGGSAWWSISQQQARDAAEMRGGTFIAADPDVLEQQVALPERVDGPAKLIAELTAAAALAEAGETERAGSLFAGIGVRSDIPAEYRDLALLQAIRLGATDSPERELGLLIQQDSPYRLLAQEQRAAVRLQAGDVDGAHEDLRAILADPDATRGLIARARALLAASGGEAEQSGS